MSERRSVSHHSFFPRLWSQLKARAILFVTERGLRVQLTMEEWSSRHQIARDPGAQFTHGPGLCPEVSSHKCLWRDVLQNIQCQCRLPASADQDSFREDTCLGLYVQVSHCLYLFCFLFLEEGTLPSMWGGTIPCTDCCMGRHTEEPSNSCMPRLFSSWGRRHCQFTVARR